MAAVVQHAAHHPIEALLVVPTATQNGVEQLQSVTNGRLLEVQFNGYATVQPQRLQNTDLRISFWARIEQHDAFTLGFACVSEKRMLHEQQFHVGIGLHRPAIGPYVSPPPTEIACNWPLITSDYSW